MLALPISQNIRKHINERAVTFGAVSLVLQIFGFLKIFLYFLQNTKYCCSYNQADKSASACVCFLQSFTIHKTRIAVKNNDRAADKRTRLDDIDKRTSEAKNPHLIHR